MSESNRPVSAPLDTQALPPLRNEQIIETMRADMLEADGGYVCDLMPGRLVAGVRKVIAPYAARIAHLERELKQARLQQLADIGQDIERELAERKPVSIDTPAFRVLLSRYNQGEITEAQFIAYIDGRTAGTVPHE